MVGLTRRQIAEKEVGGANPRLETLEKVGRGAWGIRSHPLSDVEGPATALFPRFP
ncbi:hypothetical protein MYG64_32205 (plasmid) [Ensifer adhaerens]|nr:hypothetical protein [Ensifer adhaerens]UTV41627.1 hypothetical protein MYG64_32205 [Ensifer adhaerens]